MARRKRKQGKHKLATSTVEKFMRPTEQREAYNDFEGAGAAKRVIPPIDMLHRMGILNDEEHKALSYYRDQASLADKSPVRSCIDFTPKGGHGPGVSIVSAQLETNRIERDLGQLAPLCRAVCVDDVSVEQWCISKGCVASQTDISTMTPAAQKRAVDNAAKGIPTASPEAVGLATLELKYASRAIVAN